MQSEALLTCSCGMRGLGVNGRLEQRVASSWFSLYSTIKMMHGPINIRLI